MLSTPIIVGLIGQPGAGKSTTAADLFVRLKRMNQQVELVTEFAKDLVWEKRHVTLGCQPYILGKQLRNLERLYGQVDIIVTDSPILLSAYYAEKNDPGRYPSTFTEYVLDQYCLLDSLTYYIRRVKPYNPSGRLQTEAESDAIGGDLLQFLVRHKLPFTEIDGDPEAAATIAERLLDLLEERRNNSL